MRSVLCLAVSLPLLACRGGAARAPGGDVAPVVNPAAQPPAATGTPGCPELPTGPVIEHEVDGRTILTLLDAGSEPRRQLRYRPELGARWSTTMELDTTTTTDSFSLVLPTMKMTMVADVVAVDESSMAQRVVIERASAHWRDGVADGVVEAMNEVFDRFVCTSTEVRSNHRGTPLASRTIGLTPELATSMEQQSSFNYVLPHEPIGVGASWQVEDRKPLNGIEMTLVMILDAVEISDDTLHVRGSLGGGTDEAMRSDDGSALGAISILGEVDVTVDLRTTRPAGTVSMRMTMDMPNAQPPTRVTTDVAIRMSSR